MIDTLKRAMARGALLVTAFFATAALAQAPSEAQRAAIKSQCRSDYMAHCSSVPPGGEASLQCLQKNMSSLSAGCASAVRAVEPQAAPKAEIRAGRGPKTETVPAAATAKPAAEPAAPKAAASAPAKQPSSAQTSAIRSACRTDYPKVCAGVPTGGAPALQCLEKNKAKLSAACATAVGAASGGAPAAGAVPATATGGSRGRSSRDHRYCGRCARVKNCSCCDRPAVPMSARFAAALRPAAAGSCSAWPPTPPRFRRRARKCWRQFAAQ